MIPRIAREVFRKDGIELLRDRRTIFVNVALPALLYPVLMLFALQVMQLTQLKEDNLPAVALVDTDPGLAAIIAEQALVPEQENENDGNDDNSVDESPAGTSPNDPGEDTSVSTSATPAPASEDPAVTAADDLASPTVSHANSQDEPTASDDSEKPEAEAAGPVPLPPYRLATLEEETATLFKEAAEVLHKRQALAAERAATEDRSKQDELDEHIATIDDGLVTLLRDHDLVAVLIGAPETASGEQRLALIIDQAHRHSSRVIPALEESMVTWQDTLLKRHLVAANVVLSEHDAATIPMEPLALQRIDAAPAEETFRARLAAIIPMLLVFMALSGAFYPALDLIAGERERGTLETLLSWPGDRRAIFTGKLLVVVAAAVISVILNLASLGITAALAGSGIAGGAGGAASDLAGSLAMGAGVLVLGFIALLPLVVTLSALSLALSGLAASYKEAQNYLSPLFLVVLAPAVVVMIPTVEPSWKLDIIPILGPLLSLKEALLSATLPLGHLAVATAASTALAIVVVGWSVRLLDSESFLYPGLVRAGWGRFRKWGVGEPMPGGLEALAVFAAATGAFLLLGPQLAQFGVIPKIGGPLVVGIMLPVLVHLWLGKYKPTKVLQLGLPSNGDWARAGALIPVGIVLSLGIGMFQNQILGAPPEFAGMDDDFNKIISIGGLPLLILLVAVLPAITEEALLRGTVLTGLNRGLGVRSAILVSAFCFAVLHASPWRFFPQFALGIFLAMLTLRSRSIWPAVLVHFGHNAGIVSLGEVIDDPESITISPPVALAAVGAAVACCIALVWPGRPPRGNDTQATDSHRNADQETPGSADDVAHASASDDEPTRSDA